MKKINKISSLILALMATTIGGNFFVSNINSVNDEVYLDGDNSRYLPEVNSDLVYISINNVFFNDDLSIKMKYTVQSNTSEDISLDYLNDNLYGQKLVITNSSDDSVVEEIPFNWEDSTPEDITSGGVYTTGDINLNETLFTKGNAYDAYIHWHEWSSDDNFWYKTGGRTFTYPVAEFPKKSLSKVHEGATQALVSFSIDYDDSLTGIAEYDPSFFFKTLRFAWQTTEEDLSINNVLDVINETNHAYENIWLEWDSLNTSFDYYILLSDQDQYKKPISYTFQYNSDNFSTNELVTDEIMVSGGNKYTKLPTITYDWYQSPTLQYYEDFTTVFFDFTINANDDWLMAYDWINSKMDPSYVDNFELNPDNAISGMEVESVKNSEGVEVNFEADDIIVSGKEYGEKLDTIAISGLKPGNQYNANVVLYLNEDIFSETQVNINIPFQTPDTIQVPYLNFVGYEIPTDNVEDSWTKAILEFDLQSPSGWDFSNDFIQPYDLYESGVITFTNVDDGSQISSDIEPTKLGGISEGQNFLDTSTLSSVQKLESGTNYKFDLELTFTERAHGLFGEDKTTQSIYGKEFSTRDREFMPTVNFVGYELFPTDKTQAFLNFEIINPNENPLDVDSVLNINEFFTELDVTEIYEVDEVTGDRVVANYVTSEKVTTFVEGAGPNNQILLKGLKPEKEYEMSVHLSIDPKAIDSDYGWLVNEEISWDNIILNSSSKYDGFPIEITSGDVATKSSSGNGSWEYELNIKMPEGSDLDSGYLTPNADVRIYYSVIDKNNGEYYISDTQIDSIILDGSGNAIGKVLIEGLKPNNQYKIDVWAEWNDDILVNIVPDNKIINTGFNEGLSNTDISVDWVIDDEMLETYNSYEGISLEASYNAAPSQEELDSYESLSILDPMGGTVGLTYEKIGDVGIPNIIYTFDESFMPGETLSGYKYKINNKNYSEDSGVEVLLPSIDLGLLSPSTSEITSIGGTYVQATYINIAFDISNYNNINELKITILDSSENEVWTDSYSRSYFDVNDPNSKIFSFRTPKGLLLPETKYNVRLEASYIDGVDKSSLIDSNGNGLYEYQLKTFGDDFVADTNGEVTFTTKAQDKATIVKEQETQSTIHSISQGYSWDGNTQESMMIESVTANVYSPENPTLILDTQTKSVAGENGEDSIVFDGLNSSTTYRVEYIVDYSDGTQIIDSSSFISTKQKNNNFKSIYNLTQTSEESFEIRYKYENINTKPSYNNSAVTGIKYELYEGDAAIGSDKFLIKELDSSELVDTTTDYISINVNNTDILGLPQISVGEQYTIKETIIYDEYYIGWESDGSTPTEKIYLTDESSETISLVFDDSQILPSIEFINDNKLEIEIRVDKPNQFYDGNEISIALLTEGSFLNFIFNGEPTKAMGENYSSTDLEKYIVDELEGEYVVYKFIIEGVYVPKGNEVVLQVGYNNTDYIEKVTQEVDSKINPNSMKTIHRYEYLSPYYLYEIDIEASEEIDLVNDIKFTKQGSTNLELTDIEVVGEEDATSLGVEYDSTHLYLKVWNNIIDSDINDWRDLSFLVGRYIIVTDSAKALIPNSSYYLIDDFDLIKIPLTFKQKFIRVILILLFIILLILIIWIIIYKIFMYHRKEKWYQYSLAKANGYYKMHRHNMEMYGWAHKYNEYESLRNMTIPQLREYAKKMHLPIPYRMNKRQMVDTLSLLTETEIARIHDFTEYEIEISNRVREELLDEFQSDKNEKKWMKRRFKYSIDRAKRMQEEDYSKTFTDKLVDLYGLLDKLFVGFTDTLLISLNIKKVHKANVKVEEHEWDDHSESDSMDEGIIDVSEELKEDIVEEDSSEDIESNEVEDDSSEDIESDETEKEDFDFSTLTKKEITDWLDEYGVEYSKKDTKPKLVKIASDFYNDVEEDEPDEGGDSDA